MDGVQEKIDKIIADPCKQMRSMRSKNYGVIDLVIDGVKVEHDLPKKVEWDRKKMAGIWDRIEIAGDEPAEFITRKISYNVSEKNFKNFPNEIKNVFASARIVKPGKPKLTFGKV